MRTLAALATLGLATLATSSLLAGCVPFGCGGFEGEDDRVYRRGDDSMILCASGAYAATVDSTILEGTYATTPTGVRASTGETGAVAFSMGTQTDGTLSSFELGTGWKLASLDATALDHAHVQCTDVESRGWYSTHYLLAADRAFTATVGGVGQTLVICADGNSVLARADRTAEWSGYSMDAGRFEMGTGAVTGDLEADGTLVDSEVSQTTWAPASMESVDAALRCQ